MIHFGIMICTIIHFSTSEVQYLKEIESLVYSGKECAKALGMSIPKFWQLVHENKIPHIKLPPRKYLFSKSEINKWLASAGGK